MGTLAGSSTAGILDGLASNSRRLFDAPICVILALEGQDLLVAATAGLPPDAQPLPLIPLGKSISGRLATEATAGIINDLSEYAAWIPDNLEAHYTGSLAYAPLKIGEELVGLLILSRPLPARPFSKDDLPSITAYAELAAIVLKHDRSEETIARALARTKADVRTMRDNLQKETESSALLKRALIEAEEDYYELTARANDGIAIVQDGRVQYANPKLLCMVGLNSELLDDIPVSDIVCAEHVEQMEGALGEMAGPKPVSGLVEVSLRHQDGSRVPAEVNFARITYRKGPALLLIIRDITERRRGEAALRAAEERFRWTLDNMLEGCQIVGSDWRYVYLNASAVAHARLPREEMLGRTMMEAYPGIERTEMFSALRRCMEERLPGRIDNEFHYSDGSSAWFSLSIMPIPEGICVFSNDITERKQADAAAKRRLSYRMIRASIASLAVKIQDADEFKKRCLTLVGKAFGVTRACLVVCRGDGEGFDEACAWVARGPDSEARRLGHIPRDAVPWLFDQMKKNRVVRFESIADMPGELERQFFETHGVASVLAAPVFVHREAVGFLAILNDGIRYPWTQDDADVVVAAAGTIAAVTARREAEESLRESETRLRTVLQSAQDGVIMMNPDGSIGMWNAAAARMFGYSADEVLGKNLHEVLAPQCFLDAHRRAFPEFCRTGEGAAVGTVVQLIGVRKGGEEFPLELSLSGVHLNDGWYAIGTVRDITDRKKAEAALRASAVEWETSFNAISDAVCVLGRDRRIVRWNEAMKDLVGELVGKANPEIAGSVCCELLHGQLAPVEGCPVMRMTETTSREDAEFRMGDKWIKATADPITDDAGNVVGAVHIISDITAARAAEENRERMQAHLLQAQRLESIGQLAAGIAHEINTPAQYSGDNMRFIHQACSLVWNLLDKYGGLLASVREGKAGPEVIADVHAAQGKIDLDFMRDEVPKAIEQALDGIERISSIVGAMKEFSHPGPADKVPIDINRCVSTTVTISRNEWKYVADLVTDFDESLPHVPCLQGPFNQALLNLIVNAAHAIGAAPIPGEPPTAGRSSTLGEKGTITVSTRRDGEWAEIRVADTGTGIPEAVRSRIFEPFFTTKEVGKGTGQGLAICRSIIVDKLGGTITFETEVGRGTVFIIRLPLQPSAEESGQACEQGHEEAHTVC
jgi:PAS domain S-box-containing protein